MKDFPFAIAFVGALLVHALFGLALRHNFLIAAIPSAVVRNEPLSIRLVDVPPNAPSVPKAPNTRNFSDANRIAGPLKATPPRQTVPGPPKAAAANRTAPQPSGSPNSGRAALPSIQQPTEDQSSKGAIPIGPSAGDQKLAHSLHDLDRFIAPGGGTQEGGGEDTLSGDPGSGVYFDTKGFDLGPWANQVIAIVKRNWLIPVAADLGVKGVVSIAFEVDRTGRIENVRIISTSKVPSFDQAAVNALKISDPFPPLPSDFPRPKLPGVFRFYYNLPVPN